MKSNAAPEQYLPQQIQEYAALLLRNCWTIGLITVALTLAANVVITFLPDEYKATTIILVDPQQIPDRYVTSTVTADPTERLNTLTQQVLSVTRLGNIIDEMKLYPEMKGRPREQVIEKMRQHITLQVSQSSGQSLGSFTITYQGTSSPKIVADVANRLAGSFIEWNLKMREQMAEGTTNFLATQLEEAKQNLQGQEQQLRDFKMQHLGEMPDQMPVNLQALSRLQVALQANADSLNRLEQEKQLLTRMPAQSQNVSPAQLSERERLDVEQRQLSYELWELRKKYTDSHPDVIAAQTRLQQVQAQIKALPPSQAESGSNAPSSTAVRVDLLEQEKQHLMEEQRRIRAQTDMYQSKVDAVPLREQQLTDLTRDYEISKENYRSLLEKTLSAEMATELERQQQGERFTIIDPARAPDRPFRPNRLAFMFGSLLGSLAFAIALVVVKDILSGTIKAERELKGLLPASVTLLGSVPTIETGSDRRRTARFHAYALAASLLGCLIVAAILWKVHPIL